MNCNFSPFNFKVKALPNEDEGSKLGTLADIEVGVDVTQEIEDVEDEATLEGATIIEDNAEIHTKAENEEDSNATGATVEDVAKQRDGETAEEERGDEGGMEKESKEEEEEEESEVRARHAEDNVSRSSGSSIQVIISKTPDGSLHINLTASFRDREHACRR